jgi:DNA modification methylase
MNSRKTRHKLGLQKLTRKAKQLAPARASFYNGRRMPDINTIVTGDSIKYLNDRPEGWVDLVFADPPFNIGYLYDGYDDRRKAEDYCKFSEDWMTAVHRSLKSTGSFYLAIGDDFAAELCVIAKKIGFKLRNWIIWHYTFGQQPKRKFARSHTHVLYFTKHDTEFTFNADSIRVASARQTTYADLRANPKGKLPDDVWYLRPQEAGEGMFDSNGDTWNVSRVCGTFKEREGWHGCQMPIGVLDRIIKASSNPGDIVLDPFNGSGTTVVSAALLDRKYVGIDQSEAYVEFAKKRLAHALEKKGANKSEDIVRYAADPKRASRVMTETDAFGRKRVARRSRAAKTA